MKCANKFLLTLLLVSSWTVMLGRDNPCVGTETLVLRPCRPPDLELPIDENVFILLRCRNIVWNLYYLQ
jgi:hypothetical protein